MKYVSGNLLDSNCDVLVNTVNCVGVMGKGIALQFKTKYPKMFFYYKEACKCGKYEPGCVRVYRNADSKPIIFNAATKNHWRDKSTYEWVEQCIINIKVRLREMQEDSDFTVKSIAIPALGCNNGGLDWKIVKELLRKHLSKEKCKIVVYKPMETL